MRTKPSHQWSRRSQIRGRSFRASDRPALRLPAAFRRKTLGRTLSELLEAAGDASQTGGFDDPAAVVNHVPLVLDEQGWKDVTKLLNDTAEAAVRIQSESQKRSEPGAEIRTELGIVHFRRAASD